MPYERMCEGPEQANGESSSVYSVEREVSEALGASTCEAASVLLEFASNNDLEGFHQALERERISLDVVGSWYCRQHGTGRMVMEQRTPLMVAALYGSVEVLRYVLKKYAVVGGDINQTCGNDGSSALHCAAAGGSVNAVETVRRLLENGADLHLLDSKGRKPADVIANFPRHPHLKVDLERVLKLVRPKLRLSVLEEFDSEPLIEHGDGGLSLDGGNSIVAAMAHSQSTVSGGGFCQSPALSSSSSSPKSGDTALKCPGEGVEKVREYPIDPSIPDIKNSMYSSDEFRMFSFKIRPCSRAYSHDWTECPFVHPGENARRRDPRRFHYSCVPCPDFRKGSCRRGDACEYAHGVFECWLHPAQYRTRLCKDGTKCARRVCFFAHTTEELRPLYVSTGSALPSPRTSGALDMAAMSPPLAPGSPSSVLMMSPFLSSNPPHQQGSLATPPMSPSSPSGNSLPSGWSQSNMPALHLPGVGLHASRLRAALSARDISLEDDLGSAPGFEAQSMSDFSTIPSQVLSTQARLNAAVAASSCGTTSARVSKYRSLGLTVAPTNLEDLFASDCVSSPRSIVSDSALLSPIESPMHSLKSSLLQSQLQSEMQAQMQIQLQQAALDAHLQGSSFMVSPTQNSSFSLGRLSALSSGLDVDSFGPSSLPSAAMATRMAAFLQRDNRSQSSRDLRAGLMWSDWGSPTGKPEWGVQGDDLSNLRKSTSLRFKKSEEPDLKWDQNGVKEGPLSADPALTPQDEDDSARALRESPNEHPLALGGSWMENMQFDRIFA